MICNYRIVPILKNPYGGTVMKRNMSILSGLVFTTSATMSSFMIAGMAERMGSKYPKYRLREIKAPPNIKSLIHSSTNLITDIKQKFNYLSSSEKVAGSIILLNSAVFLLWQFPSMQVSMFSNVVNYRSAKVYTLLTNIFSQRDFISFAITNYVLWGNIQDMVNFHMGKHQFLAFYMSSGVIASYLSYLLKVTAGLGSFASGPYSSLFALFGYLSETNKNSYVSLFGFGSFRMQNLFWIFMGIDLFSLMGLFIAGHFSGVSLESYTPGISNDICGIIDINI
ncbi:hypothetical protein ROZALSC1DRAFT_23992 [Rozella allomycis CSF55]|uniref:Peptidase S54 rhomboid domain-containing protein n=1 Tax=Rozella allomycis (strain CSF55) TaxID=988480 RepID=A0A4P9YEL2_ROZAC|nr:hypothetical protein ROZALSC1DRAFT_23992 [Rozella allomycis CSF55]